MKTYQEFTEAALAIKAASNLVPRKEEIKENKYRAAAQLMNKAGIRKPSDLTTVVNTIKQQVGDKIIQGIRQPTKPTKKGLELQRRMSKAVDKNKDKYPGLFDEEIAQEQLAQEQLVVPRGLKKKNPLMTPATEMDLLRRLSNRPSVFNRAVTGKRIPGVSEGVHPSEGFHTEGMLPVPNNERKKFLKLQSILNLRNQGLYDKATTPKPEKGKA